MGRPESSPGEEGPEEEHKEVGLGTGKEIIMCQDKTKEKEWEELTSG